MGHRVYLTARAEAGERELFEAKNFLPFFWLSLLDQQLLAGCKASWLEDEQLRLSGDELEYERFADVWPPLTGILLDQVDLQKNIARTRHFLDVCCPHLTAPYQEFAHHLLAQLPGPDDTILLDIAALAAFTTVQEYWQALVAQVAALDQLQLLPIGELSTSLTELRGFEAGGRRPAPTYWQPAPPVKIRSLPASTPVKAKAAFTWVWWGIGTFVVSGLVSSKLVWRGPLYGLPMPFYELGTGIRRVELVVDLFFASILGWALHGWAESIKELLAYWRARRK